MNDRQLRYAHAVWKERSFSRAASKLNVTQPALSDQVRRLEEELGFPLFFRNARGVEPSVAGRTFLESSEAIVRGLLDLNALAQDLRGQPGQVVRIGLNSGLAQSIIPRLTPIFAAGKNAARVEFVTATNRRVQRFVHQERLDFGFLFDSEIKGSAYRLSWTRIGRSPMTTLCPVGHPFAGRASVTLADLADERLIVNEPRVGYEAELRQAFASLDHEPRIVAECDDIESLKYLVREGSGVAVAPRIVAEHELDSGVLAAALLAPERFVDIYLVRGADPLSERLERTAEVLARIFAPQDAQAR